MEQVEDVWGVHWQDRDADYSEENIGNLHNMGPLSLKKPDHYKLMFINLQAISCKLRVTSPTSTQQNKKLCVCRLYGFFWIFNVFRVMRSLQVESMTQSNLKMLNRDVRVTVRGWKRSPGVQFYRLDHRQDWITRS